MKASEVDHLVDAGPLAGAFWPGDQWHSWSRATLSGLRGPACTTETVFAEAAHLLKRHSPALFALFAAVEAGLVRFRPVYPEHLARAAQLISRYASYADTADASLVILSELHPCARLITLDKRDFSVYRRKDGRPVPCIVP
ncbi:MAG: type II toxin-antitoxin system VapC family toxin [Opitutaceae bacterium]